MTIDIRDTLFKLIFYPIREERKQKMKTRENIKEMMTIPTELYDKVEFFLQDVIARPKLRKNLSLKR
jgi:hypothetical protein